MHNGWWLVCLLFTLAQFPCVDKTLLGCHFFYFFPKKKKKIPDHPYMIHHYRKIQELSSLLYLYPLPFWNGSVLTVQRCMHVRETCIPRNFLVHFEINIQVRLDELPIGAVHWAVNYSFSLGYLSVTVF